MKNVEGGVDVPCIGGPVADPTHDIISSEKYIESLGRKTIKVVDFIKRSW